MADTTEQTPAHRERPESPAVWSTPEYTVVETALEVTAYSLATR